MKFAHTLLLQIPESCELSDAALQFLTQAHQSTCATRHGLHKARLSPPSCSSWVCLAGSADAKTAPNRGPACLIIAWGSYLNFSFLPSLSFPQNCWASHCACINASASTLPSVTRGSSKAATSQVHAQKEKQWNRWSRQASAPPSADWEPLWFEAGQGGGGSSRSLISLKISFVERVISPSGSSLWFP